MTGRQLAVVGRWTLRVGTLSLLAMTWVNWNRALGLGLSAKHLLWLAPVAASAGWIKARLVMRRPMEANARRLLTLGGRLRIWQLYPPQLFVFILTMIALMAWLRHHYSSSMVVNVALGTADLAIAAALLVSAGVYRHHEGEPGS